MCPHICSGLLKCILELWYPVSGFQFSLTWVVRESSRCFFPVWPITHLECFKTWKKFQGGKVNESNLCFLSESNLSLKPIFLNRKRAIPAPFRNVDTRWSALPHDRENRGVTSLQTGYLLIVRFKYTKFSIVALNFWSHEHRINFGCNSIITGWLSGDFHWYLMVLLIWVLVLNQAYCFIKCVHKMFVEIGFCHCFSYLIIHRVGLPYTLAVAVQACQLQAPLWERESCSLVWRSTSLPRGPFLQGMHPCL